MNQEYFIEKILPYRMEAIHIFNLALKYVNLLNGPKPLQIWFDDQLYIEGLSTAFTNPAIESGIMHCRALLQFLGLTVDKSDNTKLFHRSSKRQDDDLRIEDFTDTEGNKLARISIQEARSPYKGDKSEAEKALARVIYIANKRLAHITSDLITNDEDLKLLEIASRGVPVLAINYFYTPMGLESPDFQLKSRTKNDVSS